MGKLKTGKTNTLIRLFMTVAIAACISACEKTVLEENGAKPEPPSVDQPSADDSCNVEDPNKPGSAITVAEAIIICKQEEGLPVMVEGYIVGSCIRSVKNADFVAPFKGSTAIIISDSPLHPDEAAFQLFDPYTMMPVCISQYKNIREQLNMEDHPEINGRRIRIVGYTDTYLSYPGLKTISGFDFTD